MDATPISDRGSVPSLGRDSRFRGNDGVHRNDGGYVTESQQLGFQKENETNRENRTDRENGMDSQQVVQRVGQAMADLVHTVGFGSEGPKSPFKKPQPGSKLFSFKKYFK